MKLRGKTPNVTFTTQSGLTVTGQEALDVVNSPFGVIVAIFENGYSFVTAQGVHLMTNDGKIHWRFDYGGGEVCALYARLGNRMAVVKIEWCDDAEDWIYQIDGSTIRGAK